MKKSNVLILMGITLIANVAVTGMAQADEANPSTPYLKVLGHIPGPFREGTVYYPKGIPGLEIKSPNAKIVAKLVAQGKIDVDSFLNQYDHWSTAFIYNEEVFDKALNEARRDKTERIKRENKERVQLVHDLRSAVASVSKQGNTILSELQEMRDQLSILKSNENMLKQIPTEPNGTPLKTWNTANGNATAARN